MMPEHFHEQRNATFGPTHYGGHDPGSLDSAVNAGSGSQHPFQLQTKADMTLMQIPEFDFRSPQAAQRWFEALRQNAIVGSGIGHLIAPYLNTVLTCNEVASS